MRRLWPAALLVLAAGLAGSCASVQRQSAWEERTRRAQEILQLDSDIRSWRRELGFAPQPAAFFFTLPDARFHYPRRVLTEQCQDVCGLARYICDAKDQLCRIAGDLGDDDTWAKEKCEGARASCREAQKRCDGCE